MAMIKDAESCLTRVPLHAALKQFHKKTWVIKCPHFSHHPTIRYMVYNGYYKVMSNIPKSWDIYQPLKNVRPDGSSLAVQRPAKGWVTLGAAGRPLGDRGAATRWGHRGAGTSLPPPEESGGAS